MKIRAPKTIKKNSEETNYLGNRKKKYSQRKKTDVAAKKQEQNVRKREHSEKKKIFKDLSKTTNQQKTPTFFQE